MGQSKPSPERGGFWSMAFCVLAWVMFACIVAQTFIAGMAIFTDPSRWSTHTTFVHLFEAVPILMLITAFPGKLPSRWKWQSGGLFGLIFAQYATAHAPGAGALHPVLALVLFWLSLHVAKETSAAIRKGSFSRG